MAIYDSPYAGPSAVYVNGTGSATVLAGGSATLSWSKPPDTFVANNVVRYEIFRADSVNGSYTSIATVAAPSQSTTVTAPGTAGAKYYYSVVAYFQQTSTTEAPTRLSDSRPYLEAQQEYTQFGVPGNFNISQSTVAPGGGAILSWNMPSPSNYGVLQYFEVEATDQADGTVTTYTTNSTSLNVTAPQWPGYSKQFRVRAVADVAAANSDWSSYVYLQSASGPSTATIFTGGKIYNPRPRVLLETGSSSSAVTIYADGFTTSRVRAGSWQQVVLQKNTDADPGETEIRVYITDSYGSEIETHTTIDYQPITWTDDPIIPGETRIKAVHILELRAALDVVCDYYGLDRTEWMGEIIAGYTPFTLWPTHAAELQQTVLRIANHINTYDPYNAINDVILPALASVTVANAAAMNQLRQIITML